MPMYSDRFEIQTVEHPKKIWLFTYGAGCPDITHEMLDENDLHAEECYTIQWRESKYTLANLIKKQRHFTIIKRLKVLKAKYNVIESQIIGYESLAGHCLYPDEPRLDQHPGFQRLVDVLNNDLSSLKIWMKEKDIMTNKRGLLWPFIETLPTDQASTAQLKRMVEKWRPMVHEYEKLKPSHESLMRRLEDREARLESMAVTLDRERQFNVEISAQLSAKRIECTELQKELVILRRQPQAPSSNPV